MEARQRLERGAIIARHRHADAYAAVVLEGGYYEGSDAGRWCVVPGDVLLHGAFGSPPATVNAARIPASAAPVT